MTLRTRLTLAVAAVVAAAVVAGAFAAHLSTQTELRNEADKFLTTRAGRFTQDQDGDRNGGGLDIGPGPGPEGRPPGRNGPLLELDAVTQVLNRDGNITSSVAGQPTLPVDATDTAIAAHGGTRRRDVHIDGVHYRMLTAGLPQGGAVQLARNVTETDDVLAVLRSRLVIIVLLGTALAAVAAWLLARRTTAPIHRLTDTAERIAATQDLTTPIPVRGHDDVGRLAASFNAMLGALAMSREQQKRLVADASHELRTPLTAVRTNIEFLERAAGTLSPAERGRLLAETRLELAELTTLVTELVELATDVRTDEPVTEVDLAQVAEDVAARFRRRTGRVITVALDDAAVIDARRAMVERAVSNLVDNALKFSDSPFAVDLCVKGRAVEVADRGPGIAAADRERVFDRFYRADGARTRPGSGLGLSIVAQIAEAHGGSVSVRERPGGGTVARLELAASS